jgi:hypothetical protein
MLFLGVGCFTFGYALLWTGVERFRGNNVSLLQSLGFNGGEVNRVTGGGSETGQSGDQSKVGTVDPTTGKTIIGEGTVPKNSPNVLGIPVPDPFGLFS